jgi:heme exporter protein D
MGVMSSFFAMGGYAVFVWPAYAVVAIVLVALLVSSLGGLRRNEAVLRALEEIHAPRRAARRAARGGVQGTSGTPNASSTP